MDHNGWHGRLAHVFYELPIDNWMTISVYTDSGPALEAPDEYACENALFALFSRRASGCTIFPRNQPLTPEEAT
jgi:hypothetical protein